MRLISQLMIGPRNAIDARRLLTVILVISLGALAAAFAGEYFFGVVPCVLCLYQRLPWAITALIAVVGILAFAERRHLLPIALCAGVFAIGSALAFYHVGVEQHWWGSIAGCAGSPVGGLTLDDLRPEAFATELKPCDQVDWRLFGLSIAGYNAIASALSSVGCLLGLWLIARKPAG